MMMMSDIRYAKWHPLNLIIPTKICVTQGNNRARIIDGVEYYISSISAKTDNPPLNTIQIVDNKKFRCQINGIMESSSSYYSTAYIKDVLAIKGHEHIAVDVKYWALNDMIVNGLVGKYGYIHSEVTFVTYSGHSSIIALDGNIYKKLKK